VPAENLLWQWDLAVFKYEGRFLVGDVMKISACVKGTELYHSELLNVDSALDAIVHMRPHRTITCDVAMVALSVTCTGCLTVMVDPRSLVSIRTSSEIQEQTVIHELSSHGQTVWQSLGLTEMNIWKQLPVAGQTQPKRTQRSVPISKKVSATPQQELLSQMKKSKQLAMLESAASKLDTDTATRYLSHSFLLIWFVPTEQSICVKG